MRIMTARDYVDEIKTCKSKSRVDDVVKRAELDFDININEYIDIALCGRSAKRDLYDW